MTSNARLSLRRPQKLQSSSYLGFTCADESRPLDAAVVQDIFSQKTWGEDALGWEAFLQAIGVQNFQPAEAEHTNDLASRLGASLCAQEWWSGLLKRGLRAQAYVSRRCRGADDAELYWLRTLPIAVQVDAPKGQGSLVKSANSRAGWVIQSFSQLSEVWGVVKILQKLAIPNMVRSAEGPQDASQDPLARFFLA